MAYLARDWPARRRPAHFTDHTSKAGRPVRAHAIATGARETTVTLSSVHLEKAMTTPNSLSCDAIYALRASIAGEVFVPGEHGYDDARQAWNLFADQRPAAVVFAESAADVARAVKFARAQGIRIAQQGTGHGSSSLEPLTWGRILRCRA